MMLQTPINTRHSISWRKAPFGKWTRPSETYSESGKVSERQVHTVLSERILTVTTPPDDVRLQRELSSILGECSADGWDGYGAKRINVQSVEAVCAFLQELPCTISYPELSPEPSGDLTMEWVGSGYHLIVGIDENKIIAWGGTSPNGHVYGDACFDEKIPQELIDLLGIIDG